VRDAPHRAAAAPLALRHLAALFLGLGTTAFGGSAAHIAMMEDEVVRRWRWLTHERFLDILGEANVIPGPTSTEMAVHSECRWRGSAGGCRQKIKNWPRVSACLELRGWPTQPHLHRTTQLGTRYRCDLQLLCVSAPWPPPYDVAL
jgi:hypothetical protein